LAVIWIIFLNGIEGSNSECGVGWIALAFIITSKVLVKPELPIMENKPCPGVQRPEIVENDIVVIIPLIAVDIGPEAKAFA
jgi:hypothetical protein